MNTETLLLVAGVALFSAGLVDTAKHQAAAVPAFTEDMFPPPPEPPFIPGTSTWPSRTASHSTALLDAAD